MWYTVVIVLDIFLAWAITNAMVQCALWALFAAGVPRLWVIDFPHLVLRLAGIPSGFIQLLALVPNAALVGLYFMVQLPRSARFCHWDGWRYMRERHFSLRVFEAGDLQQRDQKTWIPPHSRSRDGKESQVLYAVCPHGVYGEVVMFYMVLNKLYDGVTVVATSLLFWIPIVREFACLGGAVPATSAAISSLLNHGRSIVMLPEGIRGVLHRGNSVGLLRGIEGECEPRKGFIRLALTSARHREMSIVPVYCRGADALYSVCNVWPWFQRLMLSRYLYPWPVVALGWYGSFWPKARPVDVCFGAPIALVDGSTGVAREVDDVHREFCAAMERLNENAEKRSLSGS
jgi:1-acyl-sn-glycerol-3-phosphate acyltransferase